MRNMPPMMSEKDQMGFCCQRFYTAGVHRPGVLLIPDVWGLSDHYCGIVRRLAAEGFCVLAVDPYRKTGKGKFETPEQALAWIDSIPDPLMLETVEEGIATLAAKRLCEGRRIGVMGFCMGGQYALLAAGMLEGISACAPFYGMVRYKDGLDPKKKPRSPLDVLGDIDCPVLGFYGEEDPVIPVEDVEALRTGLAATPHETEIRLYPGAGHAFMNDTRPEHYHEKSAEDAWQRLVAFLKEHLDRWD